MDHDRETGARLRQARTQQRLTQKQVATEIRVSERTVGKWESGQTAPTLTQLRWLCLRYQISSEWLLFGEVPLVDLDAVAAIDAALRESPEYWSYMRSLSVVCGQNVRRVSANEWDEAMETVELRRRVVAERMREERGDEQHPQSET